jgi:hypothetical protein
MTRSRSYNRWYQARRDLDLVGVGPDRLLPFMFGADGPVQRGYGSRRMGSPGSGVGSPGSGIGVG